MRIKRERERDGRKKGLLGFTVREKMNMAGGFIFHIYRSAHSFVLQVCGFQLVLYNV